MKRYVLCSLVFTACGAEAPLTTEQAEAEAEAMELGAVAQDLLLSGNPLDSTVSVARLNRDPATGIPDLPYKSLVEHKAAAFGDMRDVSQGNVLRNGAHYGGYRLLSEGKPLGGGQRQCLGLLIAPGFPPTSSASVVSSPTLPFEGVPDLNEKTQGYHLLSTTNFSFQQPVRYAPQAEGSPTKYLLTATFKHKVPEPYYTAYSAFMPDPEAFQVQLMTRFPPRLVNMGNLVKITGGVLDEAARNRTGATIEYTQGFITFGWAGQDTQQRPRDCQAMDLNLEAVSEHLELTSLTLETVNLNEFSFQGVMGAQDANPQLWQLINKL